MGIFNYGQIDAWTKFIPLENMAYHSIISCLSLCEEWGCHGANAEADGRMHANTNTQNAKQVCQECSPSHYVISPDYHPCEQCPEGGVCNGMNLTGKIPGMLWEVQGSKLRITECPVGYILVRDESRPVWDQCIQCPFGTKSQDRAVYHEKKLVVMLAAKAHTKCSVCREYEMCPGGNVTMPPDIEVLWRVYSPDGQVQESSGLRTWFRARAPPASSPSSPSSRLIRHHGSSEGNSPDMNECKEKVSTCGQVRQQSTITYLLRDNRMRAAPLNITAGLMEDDRLLKVHGERSHSDPYLYLCNISIDTIGNHMLRILVDGTELPNSPFILRVYERTCLPGWSADQVGNCQCRIGPIINGQCVSYATILAIVLPMVFVCLLLMLCFMRHKARSADALWKIQVSELTTADPPVQLGIGTFGMVITADYRCINVNAVVLWYVLCVGAYFLVVCTVCECQVQYLALGQQAWGGCVVEFVGTCSVSTMPPCVQLQSLTWLVEVGSCQTQLHPR